MWLYDMSHFKINQMDKDLITAAASMTVPETKITQFYFLCDTNTHQLYNNRDCKAVQSQSDLCVASLSFHLCQG